MSDQRSRSSQKDEGRPIEVENYEDIEPIKYRTFRPKVVLGAEVELILDAILAKETEAQFAPSLQEASKLAEAWSPSP